MNESSLRVCDEERKKALDTLSTLTSRGYISIAEFEERSATAAAALTRGELDRLFADIPPQAFRVPAPVAAGSDINQYAPPEAKTTHRSGAAMLHGTMALVTFLVLALVSVSDSLDVAFWIIPVVAVLLYVIKIGPSSWYAPSQAKLFKQQQAMAEQRRKQLNKEKRSELQRAVADSALRKLGGKEQHQNRFFN